MKRLITKFAVAAALLSPLAFALPAVASAEVVYDAIPSPLAPNYPSQPFQAQQTNEFGDYIHLGGTDRHLGSITVTMDDWALAATPANATFCQANASNCNASGFNWPITVNVYSNHLGANGAPDILLATKTVTQHIPWRPAEDPTNCPTKDSDGYPYKYQSTPGAIGTNCYNGLAANITFDLSNTNVTLPNDVIVGFVYNTQSYGPNPTNVDGPYNSLNIALPPTDPVTVGSDASTTAAFWNTSTANWYADGGAGGINTFREDSGFGIYGTVAMQINTVTPTVNTIVVSGNTSAGENQPGWMFNRDASTATPFEFNTSKPDIGTGSLYIKPIGPNPSDKFIAENFINAPLSDVHSVSYDFRIGDAGLDTQEEQFYMSVYANFGVSADDKFYDCRYSVVPTVGSKNGFTTVTFDPTQAYPVTKRADSPFDCPAVPADMNLSSAGSNIRMFSVSVGDTSASDVGLDGYLDKVVTYIGNAITTYDFDPAPAAPAPQVHIFKFINGVLATAANANNAVFPMLTSFLSSVYGNIVDAPFTLSPTGWGASDAAYEASYVGGAVGDNYSAHEVTTGNTVVGATCAAGQPFALNGYTTGDTLATAQGATPSTTTPAFTNLQKDEYVIVWNKTCPALPPPPTVATTKNQCMNNGWKSVVDNSGKSFKNQGDCVSFVATKGKNTAAGN